MIVLGLDPGIADLGYGVVEAGRQGDRCLVYGSLKTPKEAGEPARLLMVAKGLEQLIAKWRPDQVAIEKLFFSKNVRTAMQVAEARGVIRVTLEANRLAVSEFSPQEVKMSVCGVGSADKRQVQDMVKRLLGLETIPKPDDAADALALALVLAHTKRLKAR